MPGWPPWGGSPCCASRSCVCTRPLVVLLVPCCCRVPCLRVVVGARYRELCVFSGADKCRA
eukprot:8225940-Lingulodinium_polyedra.AAC.1